MNHKIQSVLKDIEADQGIRILYACESGSRAWGFPSIDSDYDIRFLYVRPENWYISIQNKKDTIDFAMNDQLDLSGWDIKKALGLLYKYNAPLVEWLNSAIVYYEDEYFIDKIRALSIKNYSRRSAFYHYYALANKKKPDGMKKLKLKSFFYFVRALLSVKWIVEKKSHPPMDIETLLNSVELNEEYKNQINMLMDYKKTCSEKDDFPSTYLSLEKKCCKMFDDLKNISIPESQEKKEGTETFDSLLFDVIKCE